MTSSNAFTLLLIFLIAVIVGFCFSRYRDRTAAQKRSAIVWVLEHADSPLLGMHIAALTGISRSMIYIYLSQLQNRGVIDVTPEKRKSFQDGIPRNLYFVIGTLDGQPRE